MLKRIAKWIGIWLLCAMSALALQDFVVPAGAEAVDYRCDKNGAVDAIVLRVHGFGRLEPLEWLNAQACGEPT